MIIWIASYPKSGNTWVRSFLSAYLYSNDGSFSFDLLRKIQQFPKASYIKQFTENLKDLKEVSSKWIPAQDFINLNNKVNYFKTHNAMCNVEGNNFTNKSNTLAAIYLVRDPRDVLVSLANHRGIDIKEAIDILLTDRAKLSFNKEYGAGVVVGSWSQHYNSWKQFKLAPTLIVKYEDLYFDTKETFLKIIKFLNKIYALKVDDNKIDSSIKNTNFKKLKEMEIKYGFPEAIFNNKTKKKINFFYQGKICNWKNFIDPNLEQKIVNSFNNEMKELGYI